MELLFWAGFLRDWLARTTLSKLCWCTKVNILAFLCFDKTCLSRDRSVADVARKIFEDPTATVFEKFYDSSLKLDRKYLNGKYSFNLPINVSSYATIFVPVHWRSLLVIKHGLLVARWLIHAFFYFDLWPGSWGITQVKLNQHFFFQGSDQQRAARSRSGCVVSGCDAVHHADRYSTLWLASGGINVEPRSVLQLRSTGLSECGCQRLDTETHLQAAHKSVAGRSYPEASVYEGA